MTDPDPLALDARKGLPPHLRVLADLYPKAEWQGHPNFNQLTAFWLERHGMFRQLNDLLVEGTEKRLDGANPRYGREMQHYTSAFLNQLHGHHQIEDMHYFPVFTRAESGLKRGFDLLDNDHHVIHDALERNAHGANGFLGKLGEGRDAARYAADAYAKDTEDLVAMLLRHLEDEEDLIVPVILDRGEAKLGLM